MAGNAQVTEEWVERYDVAGGSSDIATKIVTDNAGYIYVTGSGGALGNKDIITIKYEPTGNIEWTKVWNGPGNSHDGANSMLFKGDAIYITGFTESTPLITNNRRKDFATLKYDLDGNLLWSAYYNFSAVSNWEDIAYAIDVDALFNVYITGSSKNASPGTGYRDIATIKYNASGIQQWVVRYNAPGSGGSAGTNDDIPVVLQVDQFGNIYVSGYSVGAS